MTQDEFSNQRWSAGMTCKYNGEWRKIIAVDFVEKLIGLNPLAVNARPDEVTYVRCENVTAITTQRLV